MMNIAGHARSLSTFALLSAAVLSAAAPAIAADPVFLPGLRVGLSPLSGLAPAKAFPGLETDNDAVKVLITELPPAAYAEVEAALKANPGGQGPVKPEPLQTTVGMAFYTVENAKVGTDSVRRYSMILPGTGFSGYVAVQVAESAGAAFSDTAIKDMLSTVAVRNEVPLDEQLGMMPFKIAELSGFKSVKMLAPGAAILLADASGDTMIETAPFMILGTITNVPDKTDERARFAQQAIAEIPGLREGKLTMSEPVRIDGAPGYETRVDALSGAGSTPVTVVQWLRFGGGGAAIRVIASTPREQWAAAFPRFRAVRDGLQGK